MRTTITLDSDVVRLLKNDAHTRDCSFKVALNEAVRRAFQKSKSLRPTPFVVKARPMGLKKGLDRARLTDLADDLEAEAFVRGQAKKKSQ